MSTEPPQITTEQQEDVSTLTTISNTASVKETYKAIKESIKALCEEIKNTATEDTVYFQKDRVLEAADAGYATLLNATYGVSPEEIQEVTGVEQMMEIINKSSSETNELSEDKKINTSKSSSQNFLELIKVEGGRHYKHPHFLPGYNSFQEFWSSKTPVKPVS
jgi:hypothetical protein